MQLRTVTIERATAQAAARREHRAIQSALRAEPADLASALAHYGKWLQQLLGCDEAAVRVYVAWRLQTLQQFGPMSEPAHLKDAEECVLFIIRNGSHA